MPLDTSTAITLFGIDCWDEGAVESFVVIGKSSATRTILCRWTDRGTIIDGLRGGAISVGGVVTFTAPGAYPDAPWMIVDHIDVEGVTGAADASTGYPGGIYVGPNGMAAYKFARLRVRYAAPDYNLADNGSLSLDYSTQIINSGASAPAFQLDQTVGSGNTLAVADAPAQRITTITFICTRKNLATIPTSAILAASAAPVNSQPFEGADVGYVKFDGASTTRKMVAGGAENWDMTYKFQYRSQPWNSVFVPGQGWVTVYRVDDPTQMLYQSSDLNQLLE